MKISFLASHGGTTAKYLISAIKESKLEAEIGVLITNNRTSSIFTWCSEHDMPVYHISGVTHPNEELKDKAIEDCLVEHGTDLVVLTGYLKKLGQRTLNTFNNQILNVHPALLPKFGGKGMYGDHVHSAVLESSETLSGATIHFVNSEYDEGPIIIQEEVSITHDETLNSLKAKIAKIESPLFLKAIQKLADMNA